jgi:hypothetical protein
VFGANTVSGLQDGTNGVCPRLWVTEQSSISAPGQLKTVLTLNGVWRILKQLPLHLTGDDPPFFQDAHDSLAGMTVYWLLNFIIYTLSIETGTYSFYLNDLGTQNDGIINTDIVEIGTLTNPGIGRPNITSNNGIISNIQMSYYDFIMRLMDTTKCYLRVNNGCYFTVIYPQVADSVDETYYSILSGGHVFYENNDADSQVIPNHVVVYAHEDPGSTTWADLITGHAYNADDFSTPPTYDGPYMEVQQIITIEQPDPAGYSQARVDNIAAAYLAKFQAGAAGGRVVVPHDARVELYDKVQVVDSR